MKWFLPLLFISYVVPLYKGLLLCNVKRKYGYRCLFVIFSVMFISYIEKVMRSNYSSISNMCFSSIKLIILPYIQNILFLTQISIEKCKCTCGQWKKNMKYAIKTKLNLCKFTFNWMRIFKYGCKSCAWFSTLKNVEFSSFQHAGREWVWNQYLSEAILWGLIFFFLVTAISYRYPFTSTLNHTDTFSQTHWIKHCYHFPCVW